MKSETNPSIQCSVCGQWKRLHGKDENGHAVQRFYSCCGKHGEFNHEKEVCHDCCKNNCPYRKPQPVSFTPEQRERVVELIAGYYCEYAEHFAGPGRRKNIQYYVGQWLNNQNI